MTRSLSALESKLILQLEWDKQPVVTVEQVMQRLGVSYGHARQLLYQLARDRWLAPIVPGKYELIPAERGEHAFVDANPLFIGSLLVTPYYFSFATAAFYYGLSTQASATVYIATSAGRPQQRKVRDKDYRIIVQPEHKFFGAAEVDAYGSKVFMAEPEKAMVDCIDRPVYAGDIPEVASMLWRGRNSLKWEKVADYATRLQSYALVQRLGYLCGVLNIRLKPALRKRLLANVGSAITYLGQPRQWGKGGQYHADWRIVENIPRHELLADTEVR